MCRLSGKVLSGCASPRPLLLPLALHAFREFVVAKQGRKLHSYYRVHRRLGGQATRQGLYRLRNYSANAVDCELFDPRRRRAACCLAKILA